MNLNGVISLLADADVTAYQRAKVTATGCDVAGASDVAVGVFLQDMTSGRAADIALMSSGVLYMIVGSATAIAVGDEVESAASGKVVKYSSGTKVGVALQASSASGSVIRVLPYLTAS